jgi:hypothetical protein
VAGPAQRGQEQGLSDGEAVIAARREFCNSREPLARTTSRERQVSIDGSGHVQLAGEREEGGHGTMGKGLDGEGVRGAEARQQVVGLAEIGHNTDSGLSADTPGLDDTPIGVTLDAEALEAGHQFVYTIPGMVLQEESYARHWASPGHLRRSGDDRST